MVKTLVGGNGRTVAELAESMMKEFISEGFVQQEFDFDEQKSVPENPDDYKQDMMDIAADAYAERAGEEKWFPVYDSIEAARRKVKSESSVPGGIDALAAFSGQLPAVSIWQDGGSVMVSERRLMADPLDSDFYEKHFDLLGQIAANMPKGFEADFGHMLSADRKKYIGNKYIVGKTDSRESDSTGVEVYIVYDAIETLKISPVDELSEGLDPKKTAHRLRLTKDFSDEYGSYSAGDEFDVYPYGGVSPAYATMVASGRECTLQVPWDIVEPAAVPLVEDDADDCIEVDFPAWALDYIVNAEIGSVSRQERDQIDAWRQMIGMNGYDVSLASYGQEEYFSSSPEFGLPCDCVTAKIPLKKDSLNEEASAGADDPVTRYLCGFDLKCKCK